MARLAEEFIPKASVEHVVDWTPDDMKAHLLKGGLALVPYDSDHHYDPDKRNGSHHLDLWFLGFFFFRFLFVFVFVFVFVFIFVFVFVFVFVFFCNDSNEFIVFK